MDFCFIELGVGFLSELPCTFSFAEECFKFLFSGHDICLWPFVLEEFKFDSIKDLLAPNSCHHISRLEIYVQKTNQTFDKSWASPTESKTSSLFSLSYNVLLYFKK